MQIAKDTVALLDYHLTSDDGEVLDTTRGDGPLAYLHGHGNLIPRLEEELEGKGGGDSFSIRIPAEEGYGERHEELIHGVARSEFPDGVEIEVGMQFEAQTDQGVHMVTVVAIEGDSVSLDANHPLAGIPLNFEVKVVEVREATPEELAHGHVHGPGGHEH